MNMQINLKSFLLKNETFYAEFRPFPISTRVKQRTMPSDHAEKAYGNMQMNLKFFLIKNQVFSAEFRLSFQPTRSRGRCLSITIAPRRLNLKAFLLKKKRSKSFPPNYIHLSLQPAQRRGTVSSDYDHATQVELYAQEYANESKGKRESL